MKSSAVVLAITSVSLNALAQVFWKKTMFSLSAQLERTGLGLSLVSSIVTNFWFVFGIICYATSISLWLAVLHRSEISAAYPLIAFGFVITTAVGYFYFGDDVSLSRLIGIGVILIGVVIIAQ